MTSRFAQFARQAFRLVPTIGRIDGKGVPQLESRSELSRRYLRELSELVDDGQIGQAVAKRVIDDLFEPSLGAGPRQVRLSVWRSYCKDRTGSIGLHIVKPERDASGDEV